MVDTLVTTCLLHYILKTPIRHFLNVENRVGEPREKESLRYTPPVDSSGHLSGGRLSVVLERPVHSRGGTFISELGTSSVVHSNVGTEYRLVLEYSLGLGPVGTFDEHLRSGCF